MRVKLVSALLAAPAMVSALACTTSEPAGGSPELQRAPTGAAQSTARWLASPEGAFVAIAAAAARDEGAVAYVELSSPDGTGGFRQSRIALQRLDTAGAVRGAPVELGVVASGAATGLTLATDGARYLACWSAEGHIDCATAPVGQGGASPGPSLAGATPSVAYSMGAWALAYSVSGQIAVVPLASSDLAAGSPVMFEAGRAAAFELLPLLAATPRGFVLVGGDTVRVQLLDVALVPLGGAVELGVGPWVHGAVVASEAGVAVHLSEPYGSKLFLVQDGAVARTVPFDGGGKPGLRVALVDEGGSFGMFAPHVDAEGRDGGELVYRKIAPGGASMSERAQLVDFDFDGDDPRALLRLEADVLGASVRGRQEIVVARLHRP